MPIIGSPRKATANAAQSGHPGILFCLVHPVNVPVRSADLILVAAGSSWKYNDSGTNLGTAWRAAAYNDTAWATGPAQLGYGDGDEATVLSLRQQPEQPPHHVLLPAQLHRRQSGGARGADGALRARRRRVIYLNGVEVVRSNMPTGTVTYTTLAHDGRSAAPTRARGPRRRSIPSLLVAGTNVIAVEMHQQSPSSTDISFDLELRATEAQRRRRP